MTHLRHSAMPSCTCLHASSRSCVGSANYASNEGLRSGPPVVSKDKTQAPNKRCLVYYERRPTVNLSGTT